MMREFALLIVEFSKFQVNGKENRARGGDRAEGQGRYFSGYAAGTNRCAEKARFKG